MMTSFSISTHDCRAGLGASKHIGSRFWFEAIETLIRGVSGLIFK